MIVRKVEQLEEQIRVDNLFKKEREISDKEYAPIIVKTIVFGMVGIILATALAALLGKILIK